MTESAADPLQMIFLKMLFPFFSVQYEGTLTQGGHPSLDSNWPWSPTNPVNAVNNPHSVTADPQTHFEKLRSTCWEASYALCCLSSIFGEHCFVKSFLEPTGCFQIFKKPFTFTYLLFNGKNNDLAATQLPAWLCSTYFKTPRATSPTGQTRIASPTS